MLKIAACQDQIAKGRSLGIKCARVSLLDINIDGFSSAKLFLNKGGKFLKKLWCCVGGSITR